MPKKQEQEPEEEKTLGTLIQEGAVIAGKQVLEGTSAVLTFAEAGIDGPPDALVTWVIEPPAPIAYYYLPDENPQGARFQGIPLRDLTVVEVARLPEWKQRQLKKSKMYTDTPPGESKGGNK